MTKTLFHVRALDLRTGEKMKIGIIGAATIGATTIASVPAKRFRRLHYTVLTAWASRALERPVVQA